MKLVPSDGGRKRGAGQSACTGMVIADPVSTRARQRVSCPLGDKPNSGMARGADRVIRIL